MSEKMLGRQCSRVSGETYHDRQTNTWTGGVVCGGKLRYEDHGTFAYTECLKCGNRTVKDCQYV